MRGRLTRSFPGVPSRLEHTFAILKLCTVVQRHKATNYDAAEVALAAPASVRMVVLAGGQGINRAGSPAPVDRPSIARSRRRRSLLAKPAQTRLLHSALGSLSGYAVKSTAWERASAQGPCLKRADLSPAVTTHRAALTSLCQLRSSPRRTSRACR